MILNLLVLAGEGALNQNLGGGLGIGCHTGFATNKRGDYFAFGQHEKLAGEAQTIEDDPKLLEQVFDADYKARPERVIVFKITAWDVNCPQHIPIKYDQEEVEDLVEPFKARIAELEAEILNLKS